LKFQPRARPRLIQAPFLASCGLDSEAAAAVLAVVDVVKATVDQSIAITGDWLSITTPAHTPCHELTPGDARDARTAKYRGIEIPRFCRSGYLLSQRLQLRFDCSSSALGPFNDDLPATTGLLHCGLNK